MKIKFLISICIVEIPRVHSTEVSMHRLSTCLGVQNEMFFVKTFFISWRLERQLRLIRDAYILEHSISEKLLFRIKLVLDG